MSRKRADAGPTDVLRSSVIVIPGMASKSAGPITQISGGAAADHPAIGVRTALLRDNHSFMNVRPATHADVPAIAESHVSAWRVAFRGQVPDAFLDGLSVQRRVDAWSDIVSGTPWPSTGVFVAEHDGGQVIGSPTSPPAETMTRASRWERSRPSTSRHPNGDEAPERRCLRRPRPHCGPPDSQQQPSGFLTRTSVPGTSTRGSGGRPMAQ